MLKPIDLGQNRQIVFFDGVCGLCNKTVDFLLRTTQGHSMKFAPLQGATAQEMVDPNLVAGLDSIVYWRDGTVLTKAAAVAQILRDRGGFWAIAVVIRWVPRVLRDFCYDLIAKNRYRLFGKRDACRLPDAGERARFLA